jgi:DNA-binding protein HU-beta
LKREEYKMNKTEFVNAVAEAGNISKKDAAAAVSAVLDVITAELKKGEKIQLTGFGSFEVKAREERECRNPRTGEIVTAPAAKRPVFVAGKALKDAVNE